MKRRTLIAALALPTLVGCATRAVVDGYSTPAVLQLQSASSSLEVVSIPKVGEVVASAVGAPMVLVENVYRNDVVEVSGDPTVRWQEADEVNYWLDLRLGRYGVTHQDSLGNKYFAEGRTVIRSGWKDKVYKPYEIATMLRVTPGGTLQLLTRTLGDTYVEVRDVHGARATRQRGDLVGDAAGNFRRELIYTGKSGRSLGVMYREYKNDMARPAFYQQLQYDIDTDPVIGYQGARLKILSASNTEIRYEVLAPLSLIR